VPQNCKTMLHCYGPWAGRRFLQTGLVQLAPVPLSRADELLDVVFGLGATDIEEPSATAEECGGTLGVHVAEAGRWSVLTEPDNVGRMTKGLREIDWITVGM
jgi:hypothetical protein